MTQPPRPLRTAQTQLLRQLRRDSHRRPSPASVGDCDANGQQRWLVGEQDDGTYGLRVWDENGTLIIDQTA